MNAALDAAIRKLSFERSSRRKGARTAARMLAFARRWSSDRTANRPVSPTPTT